LSEAGLCKPQHVGCVWPISLFCVAHNSILPFPKISVDDSLLFKKASVLVKKSPLWKSTQNILFNF
jgi:hypothetical protein